MKRVLTSTSTVNSTTRGHNYPHDPAKQRLRAMVNDIYDAVENRGYIDHYANIRSAGRGYKVEYFRTKDAWMSLETATKLANNIDKVIDGLRYNDNAYTEVVYANFKQADEDYGYPCYIVNLRVVPDRA